MSLDRAAREFQVKHILLLLLQDDPLGRFTISDISLRFKFSHEDVFVVLNELQRLHWVQIDIEVKEDADGHPSKNMKTRRYRLTHGGATLARDTLASNCTAEFRTTATEYGLRLDPLHQCLIPNTQGL